MYDWGAVVGIIARGMMVYMWQLMNTARKIYSQHIQILVQFDRVHIDLQIQTTITLIKH